ncbi:fasciclin-2-like isoform X1 [Argiope bruennichi]|uniref:Fasciclin-2 like protein n=1 Tax=Argiope bruennichi TaxID=94029 RepID=A0A8T0FPR8_ARGBR|nr:fasciclin-2-like isoform X1 [Argiope bruennichi]KAF8792826.1 Fasciclin-2 like protein [Argiope bruennichi]
MRDFERIGLLLFVAISGYLVLVIEGAKLIINPSGQTQSQPAGKGFGLTCQGDADNPDLFTEMKWVGPKGELVEGSSGPIEVSKAGGLLLLMFREPTTEDSGSYNCSAVYDNIDPLNTGVQLVFYQDITWEDCPTKQALVIQTDGKIRCRVSANPPATITWQKDNQILSDRYIIENDGIKVTGATEEDKGEYSLRAMVQQTGKFQDRVIKVEVHVPPEIIELDDRMEATEGNEAMLRCQASGFPRPAYAWFDPDQRDLSNVEGHVVDADTGTLIINSVKRENKGRYTCWAKNPAGDAKRSLELSVIVKPEIKQFDNITSVENGQATFECRAIGDPLPELTIRKEGQDRPFDEDDDRVSLNKRIEGDESVITLTIENTMRSDDGLYFCAGENKGAHVERAGHLTIEFAPVMSSTPSTSVKTWNGNPVNLTCIAEAIPNATITWSYNGRKIQDDDIYTIYGRSAHSNLLVRSPSEAINAQSVYGVYRCQAENSHGEQYINIELQEARRPSELRDIRNVKGTATTLTFEFEPPLDDGGLPIRAYVVKYYEENEPYDDALVQEWSEGVPYVLDDLKPRTAYKFRFAARNEVGVGEWSDERRIVTPAESFPEPPKFITPGGNVSTYPDRFQIRWTVPLDNGRKIDYFELRYFEAEKRNGVWRRIGETVVKEVRDWENAPMYEMTRLKANTYYKVEVRAHNDIGFSQDATMVFQTAAGSEHEHQSNGYQGTVSSSLSIGAIFAIIVAVALVILIIIDITCYVRYHWGVVFFLRSRVCAKPMANEKAKEAAFEDGKGGGNEANTNNGNVKLDANSVAVTVTEKGDNFEKKTRTEVDNPAFDKEKEPFKVNEETEKDNEGEVANEDTPMIVSAGAKDTKANDGTADDVKNKSPKGSKSSIAKDSLV